MQLGAPALVWEAYALQNRSHCVPNEIELPKDGTIHCNTKAEDYALIIDQEGARHE